MVPSIDVMSDFSMSELVTLSISVVKSIFGMINSSLHSDILRLQINHILLSDFCPHTII